MSTVKVLFFAAALNGMLCAIAGIETPAMDKECLDCHGQLGITGVAIDLPVEGTQLRFPREMDDGLVENIGQGAFQSNNCLVSVFVPSNIVSIGRRAFHSCTNLNAVVFEEGDTGLVIDADAFSYCTNLKKLDIKRQRLSINAYAFANCSSIEEVELPDCCFNIDGRSFLGCRSLSRIDLSHASTEWLSAFEGCNSLREIKVSVDNATYETIDGMLVYKNRHSVVKYPPALLADAVELAFNPNVICPFAFESCQAKKIVLHEGLRAVGVAAFCLCTNITKMVVPSSVELIDDNAFIGCSNLTTVVFKGDQLPELGDNVFPPWVKFKGDSLTAEQIALLEKAKERQGGK